MKIEMEETVVAIEVETVAETYFGNRVRHFMKYNYRTENNVIFSSSKKLCDIGDTIKIIIEKC